jgi:serine/threonine-protein kinase
VRAPDGYELGSAYAKDKTGTFYRAVQLKLDRAVTLKVLREDLLENPRARVLFEEERRLVSGLEHPNLLMTINTGSVDGVPYFVTESTSEPTLAEAFSRGDPLAETRAITIALGIARALLYLEQRELIYKNIRQHNVLLPRPASPKLITFRYVRSIAEAPSFRGANVQSGSYCAPELVRDDLGPVTIKANIYGLGALIYRMLAGVPPVAGTSAEARAAHARGAVTPLKEARPFLRDRAYATVGALMRHDPRRRADPATAVALLEAYRRDPLVTRPPKKTKKKKKRRRRR